MHAVVRILFQERKPHHLRLSSLEPTRLSSAVCLGCFSSCVAHDLPLPPASCSAARELVDEEIAEMDGSFFVASSSVAMRDM